MNGRTFPVFSMTGFAALRIDCADGTSLFLSLKSVNHRFLDLQLRLPNNSGHFESRLRKVLKERINRGHVEFALQFDRPVRSGVSVNEELLAAYIDGFRATAKAHGLACEPDLNQLLRMPGIMSGTAVAFKDEALPLESPLLVRVEEALDDLLARFNRSRAEEGTALVEELRLCMLRVGVLAQEAAKLRADVRELTFERLCGRLNELTRDSALAHDRIVTEAALIADRSDVEEELVRIRTHATSFLAILDLGGPLGKRLDFLLQELNREANTLLSKTNGASSESGLRLTDLGLEIKLEVERAREQVQNLE